MTNEYEHRTIDGPEQRHAPSVLRRRPREGAPEGRFRQVARFWKQPSTPKLGCTAIAVWMYLWFLSDAKRTCYPSQSRIAQRTGISTRHTRRVINKLVAAGYVQIISSGSNKGRNRACVYRVTIPASQDIGVRDATSDETDTGVLYQRTRAST